MRIAKILLIVAVFVLSFSVLDVQARGKGSMGGGGKMVHGRTGGNFIGKGYGNGNHRGNCSGQMLRLRDGTCVNPQWMGQGQGMQMQKNSRGSGRAYNKR